MAHHLIEFVLLGFNSNYNIYYNFNIYIYIMEPYHKRKKLLEEKYGKLINLKTIQ